ncbi:UNVERIFIED_CONTAM: hypothetical protein PYX00_009334 [Menopon gallinae]|uniref:Large ribosomal subunit protein mL49 n=1 Tax=Menopon gallinae TaxID=328185 RepID=A0AAW2HB27_9NEOP
MVASRACSNSVEDSKPEVYKFRITQDPEEWKYVERLMPIRLVPKVTKKDSYPSGWRPQTEEGKNHPDYFVERSKNHMLPVHLDQYMRGQVKVTKIKRIRGDIWKFHDELKEHLETTEGKIINSQVIEGNCVIKFKGDHVYYCEQWLLSKGF